MELYDFFELHNRELKDFGYAKSFYGAVLKQFFEDKNISYFNNFLKRLYDIQGSENFKKITGFDYSLIANKQNDMSGLIDMLSVFVKIKGKKNTAQESGLSIPTINNILSKDKNITISSELWEII